MSSRLVRRALVAAGIALLLCSTGAVGVNLYLNSEYLPRLIQSGQWRVQVDYRVAWTLWPGRIYLEGLTVRGAEHAFDWELIADRAFLVADVGALTGGTIHLDELTLTGVVGRVRPRLHYLDATETRLVHLPEIPGEGPPHLPEGPDLPPALRAEREPRAVRIDVLNLEQIEGLWIDRLRFAGEASAHGSLTLHAGRILETGPTRVFVTQGAVLIEGEPTVRQLSGEATFRLGPVDLLTERGYALFANVSGQARLSGEVLTLKFLPRLPGLPVPIALENANGPVRTEVRVENGIVQEGATLTYEVPRAEATVEGFRAKGALRLEAHVAPVDGTLRTRATATLTDWTIGRDGQPPFATGREAVLRLDAPNVELSRARIFDEDLRAAFRVWPAEVTLTSARAASEERGIQWEAKVDALQSRLDVSALGARVLSFLQPEVRGVDVRIRPRLSRAEAMPASPWGMRAEGATVEDLREVWLDAYRFQGRARASGGFVYEAGGRLTAGPLRVEVASGTLHIARWRAATGLSGEIEASLAPLDLGVAEGHAFFRPFTARADVKGTLEDVTFLRHYPAVPIPAELTGGQGSIEAKIAVREGVVQAGSEVHWETRGIHATTHGYRFSGPFTLDAKWTEANGEPRLRVEGRVSPYRVTRVGEDGALVGGKLVRVRMDAPKFDLAKPAFEPMTYAEIVDGRVPDLRVFNRYVPDNLPLRIDAGGGTFTGKLAFSHRGHASAQLEVAGKQAELIYDKVRIKGDWRCEAKLQNVDLKTGAADIQHGAVVLHDMTMRDGAHARDGWFGRFDLTNGALRPGEAVLLRGDLETTMRDGRPLVAFFLAETDLLPAWARSLITLQALHATGHFRLGPDRLEVDGLNARGQALTIRGRLRKEGLLQWGDMLVTARGQEVGLALRGSRVEFKLMGASAWFRSQMLDPRW